MLCNADLCRLPQSQSERGKDDRITGMNCPRAEKRTRARAHTHKNANALLSAKKIFSVRWSCTVKRIAIAELQLMEL